MDYESELERLAQTLAAYYEQNAERGTGRPRANPDRSLRPKRKRSAAADSHSRSSRAAPPARAPQRGAAEPEQLPAPADNADKQHDFQQEQQPQQQKRPVEEPMPRQQEELASLMATCAENVQRYYAMHAAPVAKNG